MQAFKEGLRGDVANTVPAKMALERWTLHTRKHLYTDLYLSSTLGGSEKYTWPILLICIVDKSLCEACPVSFKVFILVI